MKVGVTILQADYAIRPDRLAALAEEHGFESIFFPEHTHMPLDHTPHPAGGPLPDPYRRLHDLFVSMSMAVAATSSITVGSGICLLAQHDPIVTAKAVASLDVLSGGRIVLGVGYGWNRVEAANHGIDPARRRDIVRDHVHTLKALWTEEVATVDNEHVHLPPSWSWPKPLQRPHPPILLAAAPGERTFAHVADFADGWMPLSRYDALGELGELRRVLTEAGRDPASVSVSVFFAPPERDELLRLRDLGVDRVVLSLPAEAEDAVLPRLEDLAGLIDVVA